MEVVILDTEYTGWEGSFERNWSGLDEHREIVQIDAIKLKKLERCSILIKPTLSHKVYKL